MASDNSKNNATKDTTGRPWAQLAKTGIAPVLAVMSVLALLLAFQHVVSEGVQQAGERRLATAALTEQAWRCQASLNAEQRQDCPVPNLAGASDLDNSPDDDDDNDDGGRPVAALARLE